MLEITRKKSKNEIKDDGRGDREGKGGEFFLFSFLFSGGGSQ